ncbi:hypothetical protein HB778_36695 (plasmid) [Mesorhizobium huakuii]|uniref:Ubiquitin-like protease family profile domain-containing protein n=2 Tax=Mesorhizobium huakuii TaxID=28104 RepID=A0A7G6T599_9HYPH|nr:hypothetical protein HB778_36695 [Mesorhizobium huakuii]QND69311.1 hypothetical protein HB777_35635 [Mesorhizobium loti]
MPGSESEYIPRLQSEPRGIGGATAQHSAPHDAIASRSVVPMEDYDQDLLWEGVDKAGPLPSLGSSASHYQPPASAGAVHALNGRHDYQSAADELAGSNVLPRRQDGGFEAMVHQNPPTPFELNAWVPAPDFPPPFTGPVPVHHQGARQPGAPQGLSPVPASSDDEALAWLGEELVQRRIQEPALPSAAHLPVQSFGEERLLGSAADRADEDGAPAKRQRTLNNRQEVAVQGLLSESGNSSARVLMQPATWLRPAVNEAQIGRGRINNPDAPEKDLDGFKRPSNVTQNSTLVTVGGDRRALCSKDASLIGVLEEALRKGKVAETTFKYNVNPLLQFARWLVDSGKQGFATRLDEASLKQDLKQYERSGGPSLEASMRHVKTAKAGGVPIAGHALRNPYPQDEALIKLYNATPSAKNADRDRVMRYSSALRRFSDFLQKNGKTGIAARLNDKTLDDDAKLYPGGYIGIRAALVQLRQSGAGELGSGGHIAPVPRPEDAVARRVGEAAAPAPSARARSDIFGGLQSFVDLNAPTPSDLRDDAHSAPVRPRGQMLRDTEWQPMMHGTGSAAVPGAGGSDDVQPVHRGRLSPMSEAAPAPPARAPQPASPVTAGLSDTYRGVPVVDLTASSDAEIEALDATALAEATVLGATEHLSDAHIGRDYLLLEQELQGANPALAARTRLLEGLISVQLRSPHLDEQQVQSRLQGIYGRDNDTADFLFLPVNNASPDDLSSLGTHWSLLFVDRRNRERAVAYHYDSAGHCNRRIAQQLAEIMKATLVTPAMAQQDNLVDCGVYVLDGTWALVGRLIGGEGPDHQPLPLDDLVADRQALQDRLRRRLPHEEEPRQL